MNEAFWKELELVIFDVDGTLYNQTVLRKIMMRKLLIYYLFKPWKYRELLIIYHFRKERDKRAGFSGKDLNNEQYNWCAKRLNVEIDLVRRVIDKWIFTIPNDYLKLCMYPGVHEFFTELKNAGIQTAIYSDYESKTKLIKMNLETDLQVCSTDSGIDAFKPLPNGLFMILSNMNVPSENCLFIGDRFELDGLCAKNAGVEFFLIEKNNAEAGLFLKLSSDLIKFIKEPI